MINFLEYVPARATTFIDLSLNEISRSQVVPHAPLMSLNACTVSYSLYRLKSDGVNDDSTVHFSFCRESLLEDSNIEQLVIQTTMRDAAALISVVSPKVKLQVVVERLCKKEVKIVRPKNRNVTMTSVIDNLASRVMHDHSTQEGGSTRRECVEALHEAGTRLSTLKRVKKRREDEEERELEGPYA